MSENNNSHVVYSPNESAVMDGAGFLSNEFDWTGEADDQDHAEGHAIAEAFAKTGEQVLEVVGVQQR